MNIKNPSLRHFVRLLSAHRTWVRGAAGCLLVAMLSAGVTYLCLRRPFNSSFEIADPLGGNIFPSAILSSAVTGADIIKPIGTPYVGNPTSCIAIRLRSGQANTRVRIELTETPFFARSVSEFILPLKDTEYIIYPDILWNYDALRQNVQAEPISIVAQVKAGGSDLGQQVRTFSMRSVNECLLGYFKPLPEGGRTFISTRLFFAAYVNEENPLIDKILREALNTRIVRRFQGYQHGSAASVNRQVYALWYVLQKRKFRYSSISYSNLSSNVVYAQRVRTFDDALNSSQINCVDGSVLFASLLRAINITPVLVQTPGHMFVGYYTDASRKQLTFLETTMIGDVDLDDYFPEEKLDSAKTTKSQGEMSRLTFDKSQEYAMREFSRSEQNVRDNKPGYMFLEISKNVRAKVQPIGR